MVQIEIPTEFEPHMVEKTRSGALVLFFTILLAHELGCSSHHAQFHYEWYLPTFFVWVGVLSFLYSGGLLVAQHVNMLDGELGLSLQQKGPHALLFLTYTAAVAASATSSDLHQVFDVNDGPVCRSRISNSRAEAGAHFCGDLVAACVFMYFRQHALTIALRSEWAGVRRGAYSVAVNDGPAGSRVQSIRDAAAAGGDGSARPVADGHRASAPGMLIRSEGSAASGGRTWMRVSSPGGRLRGHNGRHSAASEAAYGNLSAVKTRPRRLCISCRRRFRRRRAVAWTGVSRRRCRTKHRCASARPTPATASPTRHKATMPKTRATTSRPTFDYQKQHNPRPSRPGGT